MDVTNKTLESWILEKKIKNWTGFNICLGLQIYPDQLDLMLWQVACQIAAAMTTSAGHETWCLSSAEAVPPPPAILSWRRTKRWVSLDVDPSTFWLSSCSYFPLQVRLVNEGLTLWALYVFMTLCIVFHSRMTDILQENEQKWVYTMSVY